jgi:hypothetical protein
MAVVVEVQKPVVDMSSKDASNALALSEEIKMRALVFLLAPLLGGCAPLCTEVTSDMPWADVGRSVPAIKQVVALLHKKNTSDLTEVLGEPLFQQDDRLMWVYEARRSATTVRCSPESRSVTYDQAFTIFEISGEAGNRQCFVQVKEFLGAELKSRQESLSLPPTPLGVPRKPCNE